jgi:hypothetical protein
MKAAIVLLNRALLFFSLVSFGGVAVAQTQPDPLTTLQGRWTWFGHVDKLGQAKACAEHWEEYRISADRRDIINRYMSDKTGKLEPQAGHGYRILYLEGNSAVAYMNDEDRRINPSNDRVIWVAIIENHDRFRWRIYSRASNPEEEGRFARVRCPSP